MGEYVTYISVLHLYILPPNWYIAYILSTSQFLKSSYQVLCRMLNVPVCSMSQDAQCPRMLNVRDAQCLDAQCPWMLSVRRCSVSGCSMSGCQMSRCSMSRCWMSVSRTPGSDKKYHIPLAATEKHQQRLICVPVSLFVLNQSLKSAKNPVLL